MANLKRNPIEPLFDRLGNANPQLLRELRGRLNPRSVLATVGVSIAGQIIYGLTRLNTLPSIANTYSSVSGLVGADPKSSIFHVYCTGLGANSSESLCLPAVSSAFSPWHVNWPLWWSDNLTGLHLGALSIAIVIGCYLLITDWSTEADRGTLNSLRLSPQSAATILLGKLLGVPSLVYLFLLSCLPIGLVAMLQTGRSVSHLAGTLAIDGAQLTFWFTTSLFFASMTGKGRGLKGILGAIGALSLTLFSLQTASNWNGETTRGLGALFGLLSPMFGLVRYVVPAGDWTVRSLAGLREFGGVDDLRIPGSTIGLTIGGIFLLLAWSYTAWIALVRRFDRPTTTLWSKGQSYGITIGLTAIVLGCCTQNFPGELGALGSIYHSKQPELLGRNAVQLLENRLLPLFLLLLSLGLSLVQPRSVLLDGLRRPVGIVPRKTTRLALIWGEGSPPWVALGIQVAIALSGIVIFALLQLRSLPIGGVWRTLAETQALWGLVLLANLLLLLIGLVQLIQLNRRRWALLWSGLVIAIGLFVLPIALSMMGARSSHPLWLLSFYPFASLSDLDTGAILALVLAEWLGLVVIYNRFNQSLRYLAKSEFAAALSPTPTPVS
jgi:hypothetical protein